MKRYTLEVHWRNGGIEEIDVDAKSRQHAVSIGKEELAKKYLPGWMIVRVIERIGLY